MMRTMTISLVLALCVCCATFGLDRLRQDAGSHTGCPPDRVEVVGEVGNRIARVRICGAPHLCRLDTGAASPLDFGATIAAMNWQCAPADDSGWVECDEGGEP